MSFTGPQPIALPGLTAGYDLRTKQYHFVKILGLTAAAAYLHDGAGADATAGKVVTISDGGTISTTYTFVSSVVDNYDVLIAGTADTTLLNLARAINNSGGTPNTDYKVPAANRLVTSATSVTSNYIKLTARTSGRVGNAITVSSTETTYAVSSDTAGSLVVTALAGGSDDNAVDVCSAVTDVPIGVLQNTPNVGQAADVVCIGQTKVSADGTLTAGNLIGPSIDGQADAKTVGVDTTEYVVGMVVNGGSADDLVTAVVDCATGELAK